MMCQASAGRNSAKFMAGYWPARSLLCHRVSHALGDDNTALDIRGYVLRFGACTGDEDTGFAFELVTQHDFDWFRLGGGSQDGDHGKSRTCIKAEAIRINTNAAIEIKEGSGIEMESTSFCEIDLQRRRQLDALSIETE